ncbi:MAG: type II toxin-antitoxin system YoeB family toxin [Segetibacter sp.]
MADLIYWKESGNTIVLKRIRQLLDAIKQNPYEGIGKPESLKYNWSGMWSDVLTRNTDSFTK